MSRQQARQEASPSPGALAEEIVETWPPHRSGHRQDYTAANFGDYRVVAAHALPLPDPARGAVVVVANRSEQLAALPLVHTGSVASEAGWREAGPGDGLAEGLLGWLRDAPATAAARLDADFELRRFESIPAATGERAIEADQSNRSIIVGSTAVLKWRTAFEADGARALTIRRHLGVHRFTGVPTLLGALVYRGSDGSTTVLADVDAYLDGAQDGWDHFIARLSARGSESVGEGPTGAPAWVADLGTLTAQLHATLRRPSDIVPAPTAPAAPGLVEQWRRKAHRALDEALAIEAPDRAALDDREMQMRADIDTLASVHETDVQLIHGDLHIGQIVVWSGGLSVIDFDGPPQRTTGQDVALAPSARDVAQLLCSLDHLAVVMTRRQPGWDDERAQHWAREARAGLHAAYRATMSRIGAMHELDERLLRPFRVEQFCRELIYAHTTLPRWRYAPMGALRWLYPETDR